jgi:hypothetical protein
MFVDIYSGFESRKSIYLNDSFIIFFQDSLKHRQIAKMLCVICKIILIFFVCGSGPAMFIVACFSVN